MEKFKLIKLLIFLCLVFNYTSLFSQKETESSPLGPGLGQTQRELGIYFGLGPSWQAGEFYATCNCPSFIGGSKFNYSFGVVYQQDFFYKFTFGSKLSFWYLSNAAKYQQRELIPLINSNNQTFLVPILFQQSLKMGVLYFNYEPFISFQPFSFLYFRIGTSLAFPFGSEITHTKELIQKTARLENGEIINLTLVDGKNSIILEKGKINSLKSPFISLEPEFGFNFHIDNNFFISFGFVQSIPLNEMATRGQNFKMFFWQMFFEVRYAITMRSFLPD